MSAVNGKFNVGGVLLNQPFKIRRLGHFGFNLANMEDGLRFYVDLLGFRISDVMDYSRRAKDPAQVAGLGDPNGYFTRYGTDHHAMVLFPKRVRDALGRHERPGITVNQITWQVGSLAEVGNAIQCFNERGIKQQRSGRDMPGSNWHTYLYDPDGQSNELYYGIEQIGWLYTATTVRSGLHDWVVLECRLADQSLSRYHIEGPLPQSFEFGGKRVSTRDVVDKLRLDGITWDRRDEEAGIEGSGEWDSEMQAYPAAQSRCPLHASAMVRP